ncbi:hypothetical protein DQ04_09291000 [Trypanosoma grayi]|uniref:hypothetical protein n=1 Tax=Trypanosoma grayi TaxID=71804 RepID=UPI0004F402B8|nr:hypothetical protein DQ04_09291000 [Trypanosoma grayi]KEG07608.1 hypothetical protein DQ04_09291000 [Trypanosoma grayi]
MVAIELVIGVLCGSFALLAVVAAGVLLICYYCKWKPELFSAEGEEVHGVPLQSRVPHLTEEQRRIHQMQLRRAQRWWRQQQQQDGNGGGSGCDGTVVPPIHHTQGSISWRLSRRNSVESETTATVANSSVAYGRGVYLTLGGAAEPQSPYSGLLDGGTRSHGCSYSSQGHRTPRRQIRRDSNPDDRNACSSPVGGWTDSYNSSGASGDEAPNAPEKYAEVFVELPRHERQNPTRRSLFEHSIAVSEFLAEPLEEGSHEPYEH